MELSQALMALYSSRWLLKLRSQLGRQGLLHLSGERSLPRMVRLYFTVLVYSTLHLGLKQSDFIVHLSACITTRKRFLWFLPFVDKERRFLTNF